jgi:hypothetical protein
MEGHNNRDKGSDKNPIIIKALIATLELATISLQNAKIRLRDIRMKLQGQSHGW